MKKVINRMVALVALVMLMAGATQAENIAVPAAINYQGRLTNPSDGAAVEGGVYHLEFRVWSDPTDVAADNLMWGRIFPVHVMSNGVFNILLTDDGTEVTNPAAQTNDIRQAFQGEDRYLGLTITQTPSGVSTAPEISPRQRMVSAPFAFHAQNATDAFHAEEADEATLAQDTEKLGGRVASKFYNEDERLHSTHGLTVTGATITPAIGLDSGIRFPNDIGAGSGDTAGLSYDVYNSPEDYELRLHVGNDREDKIRIEASGNIELNAGADLVLKESQKVELFQGYYFYNMDKWYIATGDGMVSYYAYRGHMYYRQYISDGRCLTHRGSNDYWSYYFDTNEADTMSMTMPVAKGDKISFWTASGGQDVPEEYHIRWRGFGHAILEETTSP